jgi:AcrR family transcriptional regulator
VTYHFGSKARLFREVLADAVRIIDALARDVSPRGEPERCLNTLLESAAGRPDVRKAFRILAAAALATEAAPSCPLPPTLEWVRGIIDPDPRPATARLTDV